MLSANDPADRTPRDSHIRLIAEQGRMGWQRTIGYARRSLIETVIGHYKRLIGPKLRARTLPGQQGEVALAVACLLYTSPSPRDRQKSRMPSSA